MLTYIDDLMLLCDASKYGSNDEVSYNKENLLNPWFIVE